MPNGRCGCSETGALFRHGLRQGEDMAALGLALHRRHQAQEIMAQAVVYGAS